MNIAFTASTEFYMFSLFIPQMFCSGPSVVLGMGDDAALQKPCGGARGSPQTQAALLHFMMLN